MSVHGHQSNDLIVENETVDSIKHLLSGKYLFTVCACVTVMTNPATTIHGDHDLMIFIFTACPRINEMYGVSIITDIDTGIIIKYSISFFPFTQLSDAHHAHTSHAYYLPSIYKYIPWNIHMEIIRFLSLSMAFRLSVCEWLAMDDVWPFPR